MKKWQIFFAMTLVVCLLAGLASACASNEESPNNPATDKDTNLILNKDGSFGGSLSEKKYGKGAPLNGEHDVPDSQYYITDNDYYNMSSTSQRLVIPKFASYQQTMQDSSGLACLLMLLNYMGKDVQEEYTELELVKRYEKVNNTQVYGNGTTSEGLVKLIYDLNIGWLANNQDPNYTEKFTRDTASKFFQEHLKAGHFVLVRYQSAVGYGWKVVIGYDQLGPVKNTQTGNVSQTVRDDVIIFAEPYDGYDHKQDGYAIERLQIFNGWWKEMLIDGTITDLNSFVIVDPKANIQYDLQPVDNTVKQTIYESHLPRNPDGGYGGTRDELLYGPITSGSGNWDHHEANYYKHNDYFNMGSEGTRILLPGYTVLQQTMKSSCGLCAATAVMKYYGEEASHYDLELRFLNEYERWTGQTVKGQGSTVSGLQTTLKQFGYESTYEVTIKGFAPKYATYEEYMQFMRTNLEAGKPIVVLVNPGGGHYNTIIGMDDMGTDYIYDDVLIIADSNDYWDGYQDGYHTHPAYKYFRQHTNGNHSQLQGLLVVEKKQG